MFGGFGGTNANIPGMHDMDVDTTSLYEILEVGKHASKAEIDSSYRTLAKKLHPDKPNGDKQKFLELKRAHEVLSDPSKRRLYDQYGEKGLKEGGPPADPTDFLGGLLGRRANGQQHRQKTKDLVQPLRVSLEQLYTGASKKMAVTREVVDKQCGVQACSECGGRGVTERVMQLGTMIQRMQGPCASCNGAGKRFKTKKEREILDVHIQKGAPNDHKIVFHEKADEHPEANTGDVVFVLKEQEHKEFKRRGADLFIERRISLVEALCGFEIEVTHLDGRKLLVKSGPGDIVSPLDKGFDPLAAGCEKPAGWDCFEDTDCPSLETIAEAATTDVEQLKAAVETQLKRQGISVGAFVIDGKKAYLKSVTREDALAARKSRKGAAMYVRKDPNASRAARLLKAVRGEGMPTLRNPFVYGNLFLILSIEFPASDALTEPARAALRDILPPPLNRPTTSEEDEGVEVHTAVSLDPVASHAENATNMAASSAAYEEDSDEDRACDGPHPQCAQM